MAYRSFGGSGRLLTRLDTPPLSGRRHPDSFIARGAPVEAPMTIVSRGNALSTLPHEKSGTVVQQLTRWIRSIFQRVSAQLMEARLRLNSLHELRQLNDHM